MVRVGLRRPSLRGSFRARTTGRFKRKVKGAIIPWYGKRGIGWLHPKRKLHNMIYQKTTVSARDVVKTFYAPGTGKRGAQRRARNNRTWFIFILGTMIHYWYLWLAAGWMGYLWITKHLG